MLILSGEAIEAAPIPLGVVLGRVAVFLVPPGSSCGRHIAHSMNFFSEGAQWCRLLGEDAGDTRFKRCASGMLGDSDARGIEVRVLEIRSAPGATTPLSDCAADDRAEEVDGCLPRARSDARLCGGSPRGEERWMVPPYQRAAPGTGCAACGGQRRRCPTLGHASQVAAETDAAGGLTAAVEATMVLPQPLGRRRLANPTPASSTRAPKQRMNCWTGNRRRYRGGNVGPVSRLVHPHHRLQGGRDEDPWCRSTSRCATPAVGCRIRSRTPRCSAHGDR